eukprot:c9849_g1_i2.p1 GENE.c9849_g1_i2~~c9849_g1_i2.p1  ORF type:complete len:210 (+),score=46.77 c9849_g1_i2:303-932(+)
MAAAFSDLDALMKAASDMVNLSHRIAEKVKQADDNPQDKSQFEDMMRDLGIASPVTREMAGSAYDTELCRQLASFLKNILPQQRGIMLLTDVYCFFNRARGVELVSPEDLKRAALGLPRLGLGLHTRTFASGVIAVHSSEYSDEKASQRLLEFAKTRGCFNEMDCVFSLELTLVLAREQIQTAEAQGTLCRDETSSGIQYHPNRFLLEW